MVAPSPLLNHSSFPVIGSYPTNRLEKFMTTSSWSFAFTTTGLLQEPVGPPPPPPRPPGPPGPPPGPPGPPGPLPPGPPKFGRGSTALSPSRNWSSLSESVLSLSQSANHLSKVLLSSD